MEPGGSVDYDLLQEKDKELGTQTFPEEEEYDDSWEEESGNYDEENWDEEFDDDTDDDWDEEIDENSNTAVHQEQRPIAATSPKKYIYLLVSFSPGGKTYAYRTEDGTIDVNDIVLVPVSGESDKLAVVVKVLVCTEKDAPYPVRKTKMINGKTDIRKKDWIKAVNRKQFRNPVHTKPVQHKPKDDLDWIDRLEMLDAILDDR